MPPLAFALKLRAVIWRLNAGRLAVACGGLALVVGWGLMQRASVSRELPVPNTCSETITSQPGMIRETHYEVLAACNQHWRQRTARLERVRSFWGWLALLALLGLLLVPWVWFDQARDGTLPTPPS